MGREGGALIGGWWGVLVCHGGLEGSVFEFVLMGSKSDRLLMGVLLWVDTVPT